MNESLSQGADGAEFREQFVAYLDGELDAAAASEIERRLAREPQVQRELQQLQQAWDLLDRLPQAELDDKFTRSTVEMIAVAAEEAAERPARPRAARWGWARKVAALAMACAAGFAIVRFGWPDANEQLLRDLPLLENLEAYRQTPSVEFLWAAAFFAEGSESQRAVEDLSQRKVRVESMAPEEKEQLWRRYERLRVLSGDEQARLRSLEAQIGRDAEAGKLRQVVAGYQHWLEQLSSAERAELFNLDSEERLKRIARRRAEAADRLGPEDAKAFADWFEASLLKQRPALAAIPREGLRKAQIRQIVESFLARSDARWPPAPAAQGQKRAAWGPQDFASLREALSDKARRQLDKAALPLERRTLLIGWLRQVYGPGAGGRRPDLSQGLSEERLHKFFAEELDDAERARLLSLPLDQMQRQLRQLYWQRHGPGKAFAAPGKVAR